MADALAGDEAPLVGVGRPGESAPHVGALRVYLPDADWKPQVRELIEGARHVVLALGWGEGASWELGEAMRILAAFATSDPGWRRFRLTRRWLAGLRRVHATAGRPQIADAAYSALGENVGAHKDLRKG